jgi:hypothetical integral membrane protein (TIGR02206 family)
MPPFRPFGSDHLAVLAFVLGGVILLVLNARGLRQAGDDRIFRYSLGASLVASEVVAFLYYLREGILALPLQLCDLAVFLMAWALAGRSRTVRELAFFWGLAGSSQAVLTPDLQLGFPSFSWIQFFLMHGGVVFGAVYLAARGLLQVTALSVGRIWLITNLYAAAAGLVNWRFGMNLGYLAAKPAQPSLLDYFGPWPTYIFWGEFLALGLFFLSYAFARFVDRVAGTLPHSSR